MHEMQFYILLGVSVSALLVNLLVWWHGRGQAQEESPTLDISALLRDEFSRARDAEDARAREARKDLADQLRQFQDAAVANVNHLASRMTETLTQMGAQQKERLDNTQKTLATLTEKQEKAQDALKQSVESRLDSIRTENTAKLEEMRKTVDEKLQSTLETRLGESFNRVVEHLERVHKGIGEMQSLASGVGDLKKVLSNVRVRGTFGEVQLEMLMQQCLAPDQYIKNAQIKENTQERVEFAIRLPGRGDDQEVLLPVDAKFPQEDFQRLMEASELGDIEGVAIAAKALVARVRSCAKTIKEKYLAPPRTTDFAILFLPTESLYAEVLRTPGLFEQIQREYNVTLAGPTTFMALLNALQMGFRSLAIEKRSSEVWQVLGAVRNEFGKYNVVVEKIAKQLDTAAKSIGELGTRTKQMNRKLTSVEKMEDSIAQNILSFTPEVEMAEIEDEVA